MRRCVNEWNRVILNKWPYTIVCKTIVNKKTEYPVPLFTSNNRFEELPINVNRVLSLSTFLFPMNLKKIPSDADEIMTLCRSFIKKIPDCELPQAISLLENCSREKSHSELPLQIRLVDLLFRSTFKPGRSSKKVKYNFPKDKTTYFDLDLNTSIPRDVPRRYSSEIFGIVSNVETVFACTYLKMCPYRYEQEYKLLKKLDECFASNSVFNCDTLTSAKKTTVEKAKYSDPHLQVISNDEECFEFICAYVKHRYPDRVKKIITPPPGNKRKQIPKRVRDKLWREHFHTIDGKCWCCGERISIENWEAGHIIASSKGGPDSIDNLRPVCGPCNKSMGTMNMEEYMQKYKLKGRKSKK